jgi:hypothetical protein
MMNKNKIQNDQLARMKQLMGYGLTNESKTPYSAIEYQKLGADGENYAIIREGSKYYIKTAPNKANLVKEDFQYIGGFRNRRDNEYSNYALAQKQFDLKMMSIKEATNNRDYSVNSWDLDKKENVVLEASDKMKKEILRERQIMSNVHTISEKKGAVCCDEPESPKDNIKSDKIETGSAEDAVEHEKPELPKEMTEGVVKEEEVLGWNRGNDDYMDKSHGTEIGDSAPFDDAEARNIDDGEKKVSQTGEMKNGTVKEGASMHDSDNQNTPTPGVGEVGDDQPFDGEKGKAIDEAFDGLDDGDELADDEGDFDGEGLDGSEPVGDEGELDGDDELGDKEDDDIYEDDLSSRVEAMEELLSQIAAKMGIGDAAVDAEAYEDEDVFGDEEGEDDFGAEEEINDELDMDIPMENKKNDGVKIMETRAYREAMRKRRVNEEGMKPFKDGGRVPSGNMNKLDDFGKHPAYQKKVMNLPPKDFNEFQGYYDMNDDSVKNDAPYGEKIGDGAPFEIDPQVIDNAIAEAFNRLKKK